MDETKMVVERLREHAAAAAGAVASSSAQPLLHVSAAAVGLHSKGKKQKKNMSSISDSALYYCIMQIHTYN
jgi:hypothetical protein